MWPCTSCMAVGMTDREPGSACIRRHTTLRPGCCPSTDLYLQVCMRLDNSFPALSTWFMADPSTATSGQSTAASMFTSREGGAYSTVLNRRTHLWGSKLQPGPRFERAGGSRPARMRFDSRVMMFPSFSTLLSRKHIYRSCDFR